MSKDADKAFAVFVFLSSTRKLPNIILSSSGSKIINSFRYLLPSNQTPRFDEFLIKLKLKCLAITLREGKKQSFQFNYTINIMIKDIKQRPETGARETAGR